MEFHVAVFVVGWAWGVWCVLAHRKIVTIKWGSTPRLWGPWK